MGRKKIETVKVSPKESAARQLRDIREEVSRSGEPTYTFNVGDSILCGSLVNCIVDELLDDGKIIGFTYIASEGKKGYSDYREYSSYRYIPWFDARPIIQGDTSFTMNRDLRINYMQQDINSLLTKHYSFGVNYEPDYQRGSVWTDEDRELLLESIFLGADIGKFVFAHYDDNDWYETNCSYEVVDGKQRLLTLVAYYENRFPYKGKYYNDLSKEDKYTFKRTMVSVGEIQDYTKETILRIFIMLNRGGKVVDDKIIENAKRLLEEERKGSN